MRRVAAICVSAVMVLAACGSSAKSDGQQAAQDQQAQQDQLEQDLADQAANTPQDLGEVIQPDNAKVTVIQNDDATGFQHGSNVRKFCDKGNLLYEYRQGDSTALVVSQSDPQCTGNLQVYP